MTQYGMWEPYTGGSALLLTIILPVLGGLGTRLRRPVQVQKTGTTVGILLVAIWILSFLDLGDCRRHLLFDRNPAI